MKLTKTLIHLLLMTCLLASLAFAQGTPKLQLTVVDEKINMSEAERTGMEQITYKPGDIIRYTIIAHNAGDGIMNNPVITDPIPHGVVYKPQSAKGKNAEITFMIKKGKKYQAWPPIYTVREKGKKVKKMASPDMITHVRWELNNPLKPNESKNLEFKVVVK